MFSPVLAPASPPQPAINNLSLGGTVAGAPLNSGVAPTRWYVRQVGQSSNGGSDPSPNPQKVVSDGVTNSTTTITSATINFQQSDVGKGINIAGNRLHKIVQVVNATTAIVDRPVNFSNTGQTFRIGGCWQDLRSVIGDAAVCNDTNSPVNAGDEVYVGAGVYRVAGYSVGSNWKPTGRVLIKGDVTGVWTGDAGQVILQPIFAESNGQQGMTTSVNLINWGTAGTGWNIEFEDMFLLGSFNTAMFNPGAVPAQNVKFRRCIFSLPNTPSGRLISGTTVYAARYGWFFDRCVLHCPSASNGQFNIIGTSGGNNDWDLDITWQNCLMLTGANMIATGLGGALVGRPGGMKALSNTIVVPNASATVAIPVGVSTNVPFKAFGNLLYGFMTNGTNGQIEDDYNVVLSPNASSRPTIGGGHDYKGDTTNLMFQPIMSLGQEMLWGMKPRPLYEPCDGSITSPTFVWRSLGAKNTEAGNYDLYGRPRPSSPTAWDVGAIQRWNTAKRTVTTVQNSLNALQFTGFGGQDFDIPLDAGSYNLNVWMQYDSNYVGPLPTFSVLENLAMGIGHYQLPISSASLNNWAQYTIQINVTAPGVATVRFACRDVSLTQIGNLYVDNFSVS